jgi:DNA-binding NarL/FixJ family response regulator
MTPTALTREPVTGRRRGSGPKAATSQLFPGAARDGTTGHGTLGHVTTGHETGARTALEIVVVEPSRLIRDALALAVESSVPQARVDAFGTYGALAEYLSRRRDVHVVIIDWSVLAGLDMRGLERLRRLAPRAAIVIVSDELEDDMHDPLARAGASAAIPKETGLQDLAGWLPDAAAGGRRFDLPPRGARLATFKVANRLSAREGEVLAHYVRGARHAEIGAMLGIAESTVRVHVSRLHEKLGVRCRQEAFALVRSVPARQLFAGDRP